MKKIPENVTWSTDPACFIEYKTKPCLVLKDEDGNDVEMRCRNYFPKKEYWVNKVFEHYREVGFPVPTMTDKEITSELIKLKKKNSSECVNSNGEIKNAGSLCLNVSRHFCRDTYWKCSSNGKNSIYDAFMNDELLMKVLKNRMGFVSGTSPWSEDDGKTYYPEGTYYCFDMSDDMLLQGMRSSMVGFPTSNFKPIIAKYLIERYCPEGGNVGDYSAGWIARAMGAWSCGRSYFSIDPASHSYVNKFAEFVKSDNIKGIEGGSEDPDSYKDIPEIDYWFSSPPYFKQEIYLGGEQSIESFKTYDDWLNGYWKATVENCIGKLKEGGKFSLIMIKEFDGHNLLDDMSKFITDSGLKFIEDIPFITSRNHLTKNTKGGGVVKNTEIVRTFCT